MNIALLGTGRTGGKVLDLVNAEDKVTGFDEANPPTKQSLAGYDVAISFLPGDAFTGIIDTLIELRLPVVVASTGFDWPKEIDQRLKSSGITWVYSSNFALGMNLVKAMIETLSKASELFDEYTYQINEVHHIHKKDSPSGTAKSWKNWLNQNAEINSKREGDNPGYHEMKLITPYEDISLSHQSKDRKIFVEGALWAAKKLLSGYLKPGLYEFQEIVKKDLNL